MPIVKRHLRKTKEQQYADLHWEAMNAKKAYEQASTPLLKKFLKFCGVKKNPDFISIATQNFSGGTGKNYVETDLEEADMMTEKLNQKLETFLKDLQKQVDYQGSREAIVETIEANDYDFTEDGNIFRG